MNGRWKLRLRQWLVMFLMFIVLFALIYAIAYLAGVRTGLGFYFFASLAIIILQYLLGPTMVKHTMNVRPLTREEAPNIYEMVEELSKEANIPMPKIGLSEVNIPNAFAYGRSKRSGHIAITRPILGLLDKDELKAVLGHEMGHIKHNDMIVTTIASVIPMVCYYIALSFMFSRDDDNGIGFIIGIVGYAAYILGQFLVLLISRLREYYADEASVDFGNRPAALASALYKLSYGAARLNDQEIKDVGTLRAFFANDINNGERDVATFRQIDFDGDGKISDEDLRKFYNVGIKSGLGDSFKEILSTHPDSLKRAKRLAELDHEKYN